VRDVGNVNRSLLIKWRWKLLNNDEAVWKDVLVAKYGPDVRHIVHWFDFHIPARASCWWKDLCGVDLNDEVSWFAQNISRRVKSGSTTRFWKDAWLGPSPLCVCFPRLFSISTQKDAMINEVWVVREEVGRWELDWRRRLFVWEEELLGGLRETLPILELTLDEDVWFWGPGEGGDFSVHSVYLLLGGARIGGSGFSDDELRVFRNIWRSPAPSKVIAFSWKLLRNRIPTKINLALRGIQVVGGSNECIHCHGRDEDDRHLFIFCDFAALVWKAIFRWIEVIIVLPPNLFLLFDCLLGAAPNKKIRYGCSVIWHATVWMLWRSRNEILFANGEIDVEKVVENIKLLSWRWGLSRRKIPVCLYYEWCWDPGLCLRR
jgi:hypothetical protein